MRWSIIRLIWLRDLRDQLRDRRTLFMVVVLPLLLYPVLGFVVLKFALGFAEKPSLIGIVGSPGQDFPERQPAQAGLSCVPDLAWLSATSAWHVPGAIALAMQGHESFDYPPLIHAGEFEPFSQGTPLDQLMVQVARSRLKIQWLKEFDIALLKDKHVDLILTAPADFYTQLENGESGQRADIDVRIRPDDDYSKQARARLNPLLDAWKKVMIKVRLARKNLPSSFDDPFQVKEPNEGPAVRTEPIVQLMVRIFPFMLVMWSLAGALYPAVDLCAGEKERGTMETLLITPALREEIVLGKFITIWMFSSLSALLNLMSMGITTWVFGSQLMQGDLPVAALLWCVLLSLPMSALFSAVALAIGAYARSSKEGQYYLMPLFLVTMPLIFLTLAPGVELNPFYSLIPVTGVALLMQRLMTATALAQVPWLYFVPVFAPVALYSWLTLKWAIFQFQREEVLFREAERIDLRLWLRSLFRDKEAVPSTGQAFFCFGILFFLRWLGLGLGARWDQAVQATVTMLAFTLTPALLMALLLNTRPAQALLLRWPTGKELGRAALLAVLLMPALATATFVHFKYFSHLARQLQDGQPLFQVLRFMYENTDVGHGFITLLLAFPFLSAVCQEIAFRGFIQTGLLRRFRPRTAVVLCSFLFALWHMNVFLFIPAFFLGMVLGLITVRSESLLPAILFHFVHDTVLLGSISWASAYKDQLLNEVWSLGTGIVALCLVIALGILWRLYRQPYVE